MNKIIFALLIASVFISSLVLNVYLWSEKKALTTALENAEDFIDNLKHDIEIQGEILSQREKRIDQLSKDKNVLNKKLKEAMNHDEQVKAWANEYVPSSINELLKQGTVSKDNSSSSSGSM